ncbi:MAG: hypothetical protein M1829_002302 [Trizodia sp. TS-e1964]|nr:MAG: hypothetical protein M1829_002302 [Trizodia sp. TS-e1964]
MSSPQELTEDLPTSPRRAPGHHEQQQQSISTALSLHIDTQVACTVAHQELPAAVTNCADDIVTIIVGPSKNIFKISKILAVKNSRFFRIACDINAERVAPNVFELLDTEVESFSFFVVYMYHGEGELAKALGAKQGGKMEALSKLSVLGTRLVARPFINEVMNTLLKTALLLAPGMPNHLTLAINYAWSFDAPLSFKTIFLILFYRFNKDRIIAGQFTDNLHSGFALDFIQYLTKRTVGSRNERPSCVQYHIHVLGDPRCTFDWAPFFEMHQPYHA